MVFTPKATYCISNVACLQIEVIHEDGEDYVIHAFYDNEGKQRSETCKSQCLYDSKGEPYFKRAGYRYYLSEFIKNDYPVGI